MDFTTRDFVNHICKKERKTKAWKKKNKLRSREFSEGFLALKSYKLFFKGIWREFVQVVVESAGELPTKFGFDQLELVFSGVKENREILNYLAFSCIVVLKKKWKNLHFKSFNNCCLVLQIAVDTVVESFYDNDWNFENIEEWNTILCEEIFKETKGKDQKENESFMLQLAECILKAPHMSQITTGRVFTCLMAPLFMMIENCKNMALRKNIGDEGREILMKVLDNDIGEEEEQDLIQSLEDFIELMEVGLECKKVIYKLKAYAQQKLNKITREGLRTMEEEETKDIMKEYKSKRKQRKAGESKKKGTKKVVKKVSKKKKEKVKVKASELSPVRTRKRRARKQDSPIVQKLKEIEKKAQSGVKSPGSDKSLTKDVTEPKVTKKKIKKAKKVTTKPAGKAKAKNKKKNLNKKMKEAKKTKNSKRSSRSKSSESKADEKLSAKKTLKSKRGQKKSQQQLIKEREPTPKINKVKRKKLANMVSENEKSSRTDDLETAQQKVESLLNILEKEIKMYSRSPERGSKSPIKSAKAKKGTRRSRRSRSKSLTPTKNPSEARSSKSKSRDSTPIYGGMMEEEQDNDYTNPEYEEETMQLENGHVENDEFEYGYDYPKYGRIGDEDTTPPVKKRTKSTINSVKYIEEEEADHLGHFVDPHARIKTENEMFYGTDIKRNEMMDEEEEDLYKNEVPGSLIKSEEGYHLDQEEDDEWEDPYKNMSMEELKERLPAYMFKDEKEKKVYFKELNSSYFDEIQNAKKTPKKGGFMQKRVGFSSTFLIRTFFKEKNAVNYDDEGHYLEIKNDLGK